jgi:putative transposase
VLRRPVESTQYASQEYRAVLHAHGVVPSMSRRGDCWDNAVAESFFSTLEHELLAHADSHSHREATHAIAEFIDDWYNPERRHSTLGSVSPMQYERQLGQRARAA